MNQNSKRPTRLTALKFTGSRLLRRTENCNTRKESIRREASTHASDGNSALFRSSPGGHKGPPNPVCSRRRNSAPVAEASGPGVSMAYPNFIIVRSKAGVVSASGKRNAARRLLESTKPRWHSIGLSGVNNNANGCQTSAWGRLRRFSASDRSTAAVLLP